MPILIPVTNDGNREIEVSVSGDTTYRFRTYFSQGQHDAWFLDISDIHGNLLVAGIPIVPGSRNILKGQGDAFQNEQLSCVILEGNASNPDGLGNGIYLVWFNPGETNPLKDGDPIINFNPADWGWKEEYVSVGDHDLLANRFIPNQHDIEAVIGLRDEINNKASVAELNNKVNEAPKNGLIYGRKNGAWNEILIPVDDNDHDTLINRGLDDQHPQSAITGLVDDLSIMSSNISGLQTSVNSMRKPYSGNITINVSKTGNDTNDGINAPILTLARARTVMQGIMGVGYPVTVTVKLGDGVWEEGLVLDASCTVGIYAVNISGNGVGRTTIAPTASSVDCIFFGGNKFYPGITVSNIGFSSGRHILNLYNTYAAFYNVDFGQATGVHISLDYHSSLNIRSRAYSISGNAVHHMNISNGSIVIGVAANVTLNNTPNFGIFCQAANGSVVQWNTAVFTGGATGPRYSVSTNSIINVGGAGTEFLPGDRAGGVNTPSGGIYV